MNDFLKINVDGQFAVIGDSHGCYYEFKELLDKIWENYGKDTFIISVGDNIDRGDYNLDTINYCIELFKKGKFIEVQSNHMDKFVRWLKGNKVKVSYGLQKTVEEFKSLSISLQEKLKEKILNYWEKIPLYIIVNGNTIIAHAGIKDEYIGRKDKKVRSFVLYGATTGKFLENGFPERLDWTKWRKINEKSPKIIYGHQIFEEPYVNNRAYGIDTGCVLGNKLTAYLPKLDKFEFVKAKKQYYSFEEK